MFVSELFLLLLSNFVVFTDLNLVKYINVLKGSPEVFFSHYGFALMQ